LLTGNAGAGLFHFPVINIPVLFSWAAIQMSAEQAAVLVMVY
jgi:hypothetical protein